MSNPTILVNEPNEILLGDNNFEDKTILSGENAAKNSVLGAVLIAAGAATADPGNTGDGTVTGLALTAGGPAKIGSYILTCIDDKINDAISVATPVAGGGNTGNGTVTEQAASSTGAPAKQGTWTLNCVETITNSGRFELVDPDGISVASDILIPAGAGNNVVFAGAGITFKITDGATDFAAGDTWTMAVTGADGGQWSLKDPGGNILLDDIKLPGTAGGTVAVTAGGITFTITDGATDFETNDFFTITVVAGSGKLKVCVSTSTDGSQLAKYITTVAVNASSGDIASRVCKSGDVRESLLVFGGSDTIDTVVNGQTHKENLADFGTFVIKDNVNDRLEP